jgi:exosortase
MQLVRFTFGTLVAVALAVLGMPAEVTGPATAFLQQASAETAAVLFGLAGTPFTRDGVLFSFYAFDVEVAQQCSGIRSATTTLVCAFLLGQLFLSPGWTRWAFVLITIPVTILKNAARITGITWLGLYVDPGFMTGELHRYSGLPFALLSVAMLLPIFLWLRRRKADIK